MERRSRERYIQKERNELQKQLKVRFFPIILELEIEYRERNKLK